MRHSIKIHAVWVGAFLAFVQISCGKSAPPPKTSENDDDYLEDIVGEVDESEVDEAAGEEEKPAEEAYKGRTKLTVNLRVVNSKNPKGSFKLMDSNGKVVVEKGKLGETLDVDQGSYTLEFKTPLVFDEPVYKVENVKVEGPEMTIDESFPAGEIKLETYRGKPGGNCKSVSFSVRNQTEERDLKGKGKTCKPIILEAGSYELLLDIGKNKVQPVSLKVDREQVSSAAIELEK